MKTIEFNCPFCQHPMELSVSFSGREMPCPSCSNIFQVPQVSAASATDHSGATAKEKINPQQIFATGTRQAKHIFDDLRKIKFKEEVIPIDQSNIQALLKDYAFWAVTLMGVLPLLIVTVQQTNTQLTLFALFFAFVWGVILKRFAINEPGGWGLPIASLFFTGVIGIWLLLFIYRNFLPDFYLSLADSKSSLVSLFGFIFQVGVWEEITKALPLLLVVALWRSKIRPLHLVTIGVFSGLGFAAFENLYYGETAINRAFAMTQNYGALGLESGVKSAMINTMLRAVSLVFCHAVWSGIVSYFVATALIRKERVAALIILGVMVAAFLHGFYNWLQGHQQTIAALVAGFSFVLFYGYLIKLRSMGELYESQKDVLKETA